MIVWIWFRLRAWATEPHGGMSGPVPPGLPWYAIAPGSFCPVGIDAVYLLAVGIEQVVGKFALEREFPHGNAEIGRDVHVSEGLHDSAALQELAVDFQA